MVRRLFKLFFSGGVALACASSLLAYEFKSPLTMSQGPMRHLFEGEQEGLSARMWSGFYSSFARKAFGQKHGRNKIDFPALIFNETDFRVAHIFQNCLVEHTMQYYNPLLRTAKMRLRADYSESGVFLGARVDYPFMAAKNRPGRIGVRATLPFRRCTVSKKDTQGVRMGGQLEDVLVVQPDSINDGGSTPSDTFQAKSSSAIALRLDLLEALIQSGDRNSFINYKSNASANPPVKAGATEQSVPNTTGLQSVSANTAKNIARDKFVMVYSPEGFVPRPSGANNSLIAYQPFIDNAKARPLPTDAKVSADAVYFFDSTKNYTKLADNDVSKSLEARKTEQENKATVWAIPVRNNTDNTTYGELTGTEPGGVLATAQKLTGQITENVYEWLHDRGMDFESYSISDVGDIPVRVYYEQQVTDRMALEINGGVTIPTGGRAKYKSNPYQIYPGNGGHIEAAVGGAMAWALTPRLTMKMHGEYKFVLNREEERVASFKGSAIKNIGPMLKADVKWQEFMGGVTFSLTHPSTSGITGSVGYEFFYKRKEDIKFLADKAESWLGKKYAEVTSNGTTTKQFVQSLHDIDHALAAAHTNAIKHSVSVEAAYLLSDWLEFYWGAKCPVAGRNCLVDYSGYGGFHIAF